MKKRLSRMLLFFLSLVVLQQMLAWLGDNSSLYKRQREMILQRDMDPAVFFYTESDHALKAEKEVRERIGSD